MKRQGFNYLNLETMTGGGTVIDETSPVTDTYFTVQAVMYSARTTGQKPVEPVEPVKRVVNPTVLQFKGFTAEANVTKSPGKKIKLNI